MNLERQRRLTKQRMGWFTYLLCCAGLCDFEWCLWLEARKHEDTKELADKLGSTPCFGANDL